MEWQPPTSLIDDLVLHSARPEQVDLGALHRLAKDSRRSLRSAAHQVRITLDTARHLLEQHPVPTAARAATRPRPRGTASAALPKELLENLYRDQRLSLESIGQRVGLSSTTVGRLAREYGIPRRFPGRATTTTVSRDWLHEQYVVRKRTLLDLAQEAGMSASNMKRWTQVHKIPLRPRGGQCHVQVTQTQAAVAPRILRPAFTGHEAWERLRRFATAATYPTFDAAAEALRLHPSPLSVQIKRLEHDLGGALLIRAQQGQPMRLTPFGKKVAAAISAFLPKEMTPAIWGG